MPTEVAPAIARLSETLRGVDHDIVGRAGAGVLLVRAAGSDESHARLLTELRARIPIGRGSAVVVRGSDAFRTRVDPWGPLGDALPLMRAIKKQFDPAAVLNPGRGPGGL
jgi:glycolate oxidase FAD binding subunit